VDQPVSAATDTPVASPGIRTFLIADIRGYTRFTLEYGDEAAARLAARFAQLESC
jgi:class 3 adenylate cyclase